MEEAQGCDEVKQERVSVMKIVIECIELKELKNTGIHSLVYFIHSFTRSLTKSLIPSLTHSCFPQRLIYPLTSVLCCLIHSTGTFLDPQDPCVHLTIGGASYKTKRYSIERRLQNSMPATLLHRKHTVFE
jgi:hypothetical protein